MAPINFARIKLLIVDMDNTLCDTFHTLSKPQWGKVETALNKKDWKEYAHLLKKNFGKHGFKHTLERSGMTPAQMRYAINVYDNVDVSPLRLFPDAKNILQLQLPKVLISRGEPSLQKKKIRHLKLRPHFDELIIIDTFHTKTQAIKNIVRKYKLKQKEALIIGDRIEEEIADGKKLGIPTVLVRRPDWPVAKSRYKPDLTVRSLRSIAKKLNL